MLGLRQSNGVSIDGLNDLGYNILQEKAHVIERLKQHNIISLKNNHIMLTPNSFGVCSAVIMELI